MRSAIAILLAACGGTEAVPDAALVDAAPFVPGPNRVSLSVLGTTDYIRYRDANGPWTTPEAEPDGVYPLHITDDYEVVIACGDPAMRFDSHQLRSTFADGSVITMFCDNAFAFAPVTVRINGVMNQPGDVSFGFTSQHSDLGPRTFQLDVQPDTYDLLAFGDSRMLVRRGVDGTVPGTQPTVDVDTDGAAYVGAPFMVTTEPTETISAQVVVETAAGFGFIPAKDMTLRRMPDALAVSGDVQRADITALADPYSRSIQADYTGTQITFELLPRLDVAFSFPNFVITAQWTTLPATYDELYFACFGTTGYTEVEASQRWLDGHHRTFLAFDDLPLDYDPRRVCATGGPYIRDVYVFASQPGVFQTSEYSEFPNGAIAHTPIQRFRGPRGTVRGRLR